MALKIKATFSSIIQTGLVARSGEPNTRLTTKMGTQSLYPAKVPLPFMSMYCEEYSQL